MSDDDGSAGHGTVGHGTAGHGRSGRGAAVRFGFLGVGGIVHRALLPAVTAADGAVLQAAAARDLARAEAIGPAGRAYGDYAALLADEDVDVVYISLPNDAHRPWTLRALEAGKHVLCEKPLGLDTAEVHAMHDAAAAAGRLLVEAFWYRWHPRTRRLEQLAAQGAFGQITAVETDFSFDGDFTGPAADDIRMDPAKGGGALYDVGCYAVSAARTVLDAALPAARDGAYQVVKTDVVRGGKGVDTRAWATLHGPTGVPVMIGCGVIGTNRQVVSVEGGALSAWFPGGDAFTNRDTASVLALREAGSAEVREESFAPVDPYRVMVEHVAAAVRGEDEVKGTPTFLVDAAHSLGVARVLDRVRAAVDRG